MTVDDIVQALFRVLCDHQRAKGTEADMRLAELRLALGVTEAQLMEGRPRAQALERSVPRVHGAGLGSGDAGAVVAGAV
jgi:hypothetical protein